MSLQTGFYYDFMTLFRSLQYTFPISLSFEFSICWSWSVSSFSQICHKLESFVKYLSDRILYHSVVYLWIILLGTWKREDFVEDKISSELLTFALWSFAVMEQGAPAPPPPIKIQHTSSAHKQSHTHKHKHKHTHIHINWIMRKV